MCSPQELKDTYLRLAADFDNFRKRSQGDLGRARDEATGAVLKVQPRCGSKAAIYRAGNAATRPMLVGVIVSAVMEPRARRPRGA